MTRAAQVRDAPWGPIALRRHGAKPLVFRGALALQTDWRDAVAGARFRLALYVAEDGGAVAAVAVEPPPGTPGGPLHHAAPIPTPDALRALVTRIDPGDALALAEDDPAGSLAAAEALRADYAAFAAALSAHIGPDRPPPADRAGADPVAAAPAGADPVAAAAPDAAPAPPPPSGVGDDPTAHDPVDPFPETPIMNPMSPYAETPEPPAARVPAMVQAFTLKRSGAKPLVIQGSELAMGMSFSPSAPSWYEINLYRTQDQRFVAAVKLFYRDADKADIGHAWEFDDFAAAVAHLEAFDPAADVRVEVDPDDAALSLPEMAAHALSLRAKAAEARRQYRTLLGEVLHDLETA